MLKRELWTGAHLEWEKDNLESMTYRFILQYSIALTSTQYSIRVLVTIPTSCIQIKHKHNKKRKPYWSCPSVVHSGLFTWERDPCFNLTVSFTWSFHSFICSKNASLSVGVLHDHGGSCWSLSHQACQGTSLVKILFAVQQSSKIILYWKPLKS